MLIIDKIVHHKFVMNVYYIVIKIQFLKIDNIILARFCCAKSKVFCESSPPFDEERNALSQTLIRSIIHVVSSVD